MRFWTVTSLSIPSPCSSCKSWFLIPSTVAAGLVARPGVRLPHFARLRLLVDTCRHMPLAIWFAIYNSKFCQGSLGAFPLFDLMLKTTLPETNSLPWKIRPHPERRWIIFQPSIFSGANNGKKSREGTPWKINMEHNHGGLEDHFPF